MRAFAARNCRYGGFRSDPALLFVDDPSPYPKFIARAHAASKPDRQLGSQSVPIARNNRPGHSLIEHAADYAAMNSTPETLPAFCRSPFGPHSSGVFNKGNAQAGRILRTTNHAGRIQLWRILFFHSNPFSIAGSIVGPPELASHPISILRSGTGLADTRAINASLRCTLCLEFARMALRADSPQ